MARSAAASSPSAGSTRRSRRDVADWSKLKYGRFIAASGGWAVLQRILGTAAAVATRHGVSLANVATRWVLDQPAVAAVIVGARLGEREHRDDNLRLFSFALDAEDSPRWRRPSPPRGAFPAIAATNIAGRRS